MAELFAIQLIGPESAKDSFYEFVVGLEPELALPLHTY